MTDDNQDPDDDRDPIDYLPADAIPLGTFKSQDGNPQGTFPPLVQKNGIIEPGHSVNWWGEAGRELLLNSAYPDAIDDDRYPGRLKGDWKFLGSTTPSVDTRTARIPKNAREPDENGGVFIDTDADEEFVIVTSGRLLQRRAALLVPKDVWDDYAGFTVVLS